MHLLVNGNMFLTVGYRSGEPSILSELVNDQFVKLAAFKTESLLELAIEVLEYIKALKESPRALVVQESGIGLGALDALAQIGDRFGSGLTIVSDRLYRPTRRPLFGY